MLRVALVRVVVRDCQSVKATTFESQANVVAPVAPTALRQNLRNLFVQRLQFGARNVDGKVAAVQLVVVRFMLWYSHFAPRVRFG